MCRIVENGIGVLVGNFKVMGEMGVGVVFVV